MFIGGGVQFSFFIVFLHSQSLFIFIESDLVCEVRITLKNTAPNLLLMSRKDSDLMFAPEPTFTLPCPTMCSCEVILFTRLSGSSELRDLIYFHLLPYIAFISRLFFLL